MKNFVVAVDFDGTCVTHAYPAIGKEVPGCVSTLKWLDEMGVKIILHTMRSGEYLDKAVKWFMDRGIPLWGINCNPDQSKWTDSPKVYANLYVDDAAVGVPLTWERGVRRPFVNWDIVQRLLLMEIDHPEPIIYHEKKSPADKTADRGETGKGSGGEGSVLPNDIRQDGSR